MEVARTQNRGQDEQGTDARVDGEGYHSVQYGLAQRTECSQTVANKVELCELYRRSAMAYEKV